MLTERSLHIKSKTKGSKMVNERVHYLLYFFVFLTVFYGCSKDSGNPVNSNNSTPRSDIPEPIAKEWYAGDLQVQTFLILQPEVSLHRQGREYFSSSLGTDIMRKEYCCSHLLYGCTSTFYAFNKGTVVIEGNKMTLYPTYGKIKSEDNCVSENNYEKPDNVTTEVIYWELGYDEFNQETLWLRYETGDPSAFHIRN